MSKGAFKVGDCFQGHKSMSSERSQLLTNQGKMSSAHGTNSGDATKGMSHASGRIGASKKGFSKGLQSQGPHKIK